MSESSNVSSDKPSGKAHERTERFLFVDFLRGIAALLVAFFHLQVHGIWGYPGKSIPKDSFTYRFVFGDFGLGTYGVALFFMISGFLIPSTLRGTNANLRRFAVARFFRLYPAYWLSIVAAVVAAGVKGLWFPAVRLLANTTMLQGFLGQRDIIGVYWTLQIELVFYVLCAALFYFRKLERRETLVIALLAASLGCAGARYALGRKLPVALFLALSLMFLSDMVRHARIDAVLRRRVPGYLAVTCAVIVPTCWLAYGPGAGTSIAAGVEAQSWGCYVLSYLVAIATFLIAYRFAFLFSLNHGIRALSEWLGEISYLVYLFHSLVAFELMTFLVRRGFEKELCAALGLGATALFATLGYRLFERYFIQLGRRVASRRPGRIPVATISSVD